MTPRHLRNLEPEPVKQLLARCLPEGCRGSRLLRATSGRALIEQLIPGDEFREWSRVDRANMTEKLLYDSCNEAKGKTGPMAYLVLGLDPSVYDTNLTFRREQAAQLIEQTGETFRRRTEAGVLWDIAHLAITLAAKIPGATSADGGQLRLHLVG